MSRREPAKQVTMFPVPGQCGWASWSGSAARQSRQSL